MTSPNRPPSCDKLKPKLKECPFCESDSKLVWGYKDTERSPYITCLNPQCSAQGPWPDPHGHKWNSTPRRSEVAELLRLVDETIIAPPTPAEGRLLQCAAKLRKEWNL